MKFKTYIMKKIVVFIFIGLFLALQLVSQTTLSYRLNNPQIENNLYGWGMDYLTFDIEIKADDPDYYLHGLQVQLTFNTTAFQALGLFPITVDKGPLTSGTYGAGTDKYNINTNTIGNEYSIGFVAAYNPPPANTSFFPSIYNAAPVDWAVLGTVHLELTDNTVEADLAYVESVMNTNQYYAVASGTASFNNPSTYNEDMDNLYLGKIYCDAHVWSPAAPDASDGTTNVSVWNGTGQINAAQATAAAVQNIRVHDHTTIDDAVLSIEPGAGLTAGTIDNQVAGGVIVQSDGTGTGSLIATTLAGSGTYTVERYYPPNNLETTDYFFHQVSAPVANQTLGDFDLIHTQSYAYEYRPLTNEWFNIYATGRPTDLGYGFILSFIETTAAQTKTFTDAISVANHPLDVEAGYVNLMGNPYPSPIDMDAVYTTNSAGVNPVVYIWKATQGSGGGGSYVEYNASTHVGDPSAHYVQVGQAFFMETTTATTFNINASHRAHGDQPYLKEEPANVLKMYTSGGNVTSDQLYVHFGDFEDISGGYDEKLDAEKWMSLHNEKATEIFTIGTDGSQLSIDARPEISDAQTDIPMHFKAAVDAEYTLHAESVESFFPSIKIFLEDTFLPEQDWVDLREHDSYTFNASPEDEYNRFVLHFYDSEFGIEEPGFEPIKIFSDRTDAIIVNDSEQLIKEILIYDMMGNLIDNKIEVNSDQIRMYVSDKTGYYVVKVITDKAVYSNKVLIAR